MIVIGHNMDLIQNTERECLNLYHIFSEINYKREIYLATAGISYALSIVDFPEATAAVSSQPYGAKAFLSS